MTQDLRIWLYPLGLIANLLFGCRFYIQWIQSEKQKRSVVSKSFWIISLTANGCMAIHDFIQLQYPLCAIQVLNGVIAWRNLNLMRPTPSSSQRCLRMMALALFSVTALFALQSFFTKTFVWMRAPTMPLSSLQAGFIGFGWHVLGFAGMLLFASRFWIQWWQAEKHQKSYLGKPFWWLSLTGGCLSLLYFIRLLDLVNILGYSLGLIPYLRNLVLSQRRDQAPQSNSLYFFAGEQSGDVLGEGLMLSLKKQDPSVQLLGVGGPKMREAGLFCSTPMEKFQVMGFSDVAKALPRLFGHYQAIQKEILEKQPKGVILIDYPDFNMRLAKALRKKGYHGKIVHYVCPTVWAWRKGRIKDLAKTLDHLLAILPFEPPYFKKTQLPVTYVGHPLAAAIRMHAYDPAWKKECSITDSRPLLTLFPGSRRHEILLNLPIQWRAAKRVAEQTGFQIVISSARPDLDALIHKLTDPAVPLVPHLYRYELMQSTSAAFATSGTVTLELGLHAAPTVVCYKLTNFNYLLGRYLFRIRLPFYALVNIICNKEVFPEFFHKELSEEKLAASLLNQIEKRASCQQECHRLHSILSGSEPNEEAAKVIGSLIS